RGESAEWGVLSGKEAAEAPRRKPPQDPKNPPKQRMTTNVTNAIALTLKGWAVSTDSIRMAARIEFCHSAARQRNRTTMKRQAIATNVLAMDRIRAEGSGSSRQCHSQRQGMPAAEPIAKQVPASTPCVRELPGGSVGQR